MKNVCDSCITPGCTFQSGIHREKCDFYTDRDACTEALKRMIFETMIVNCKDCRHNGSFDTDCPISWPKDDDDFCSFAEKL